MGEIENLIISGNLKKLKEIVGDGLDLITSPNTYSYIPLACIHNHLDVISYLLSLNINPNVLYGK